MARCQALSAELECSGAFVGGSLADGLGHSLSDLDICLIDPIAPMDRVQIGHEWFWQDVHALRASQVEDLAARLGRARLTRLPSPELLPDRSLALLIDVMNAVPVVGSPQVEALRRSVSKWAVALRRQLIFRWAAIAHSSLEDVVGLRRDGDERSAVLASRAALVASVKCLLAGVGDLTMGEKWVGRQVSRSLCALLPGAGGEELADLMLGPDRRDDLFTCLELMDGWTSAALAAASSLGWHGCDLRRLVHWPASSFGCRRSPGFYARPFEECVVLASLGGRQVRLSHRAALVWAMCDGRPLAEIEKSVTALGGWVLVGSRMGLDVSDCLERLVERELVQCD